MHMYILLYICAYMHIYHIYLHMYILLYIYHICTIYIKIYMCISDIPKVYV